VARLPFAVASYSSIDAHPRAVDDPLRARAGSRIVTALLLGAVWLTLMLVAHDQVVRSMFLIKLLVAPFAFLFVVAMVELPRLLLGVQAPQAARGVGEPTTGAGFVVLVAVSVAAFLAVSAVIAFAFLA
jgi:hypothetical protein